MAPSSKKKTGPTAIKAAIFTHRSTCVPDMLWRKLYVRAEGLPVSQKLEDWGAEDIRSTPVISLLVTARESTGIITSSKLVIRGPVFVAGETNPIKASDIWQGVSEEITLRFTIPGESLNFSNKEARNFSMWASLDSLTDLKFFKGNDRMTSVQVAAEEGIQEGASFRVAAHTHSATHMAVTLLVAPRELGAIRTKARDWNVAEESNHFPAINISSHWTR